MICVTRDSIPLSDVRDGVHTLFQVIGKYNNALDNMAGSADTGNII